MMWTIRMPGRVKQFKACTYGEAERFAQLHASRVHAGWWKLFDHDNQLVSEGRTHG